METIIQCENLCLNYGAVSVWDDVHFSLTRGEIVALIGLNGAGKTSLLQVLAGIQKPTHGSIGGIAYTGRPSLNHSVLISPKPFLYGHLTVRETFSFYSHLLNIPVERAYRLEDAIGLSQYSRRRADSLSYGNQLRLAAAFGFLAPSPLVMFDELFNGLDVVAVERLVGLLKQWKSKGTTFLISSHILEVVETVTDRFMWIHQYRLSELSNESAGIRLRDRLRAYNLESV